MNVSFTGLQNIGAASNINAFRDNIFKGEPEIMNRLVVQLTNIGTKDLQEFQEVLKKFPDKKTNNNFLRIDMHSKSNIEEIKELLMNPEGLNESSSAKGDIFELNEKPLDFYQDASVFSKIAKLINRIVKDKEEFPLSKGYLESEDVLINLQSGVAPEIDAKMANAEILPIMRLHGKENVQMVAHKIEQGINNTMESFYLA